MKGDVGMSPHEKEGEQEYAYTKTTHSQPHPYIFVYFWYVSVFVDEAGGTIDTLLTKSMFIQINKDVGMGLMNEFLFWSRVFLKLNQQWDCLRVSMAT